MARVLVIEDNADNRDLMTYLLCAFGHSVTTAVDGDEALARLEGSYDVVVCDIHLPKVDGLEIVKIIKARPELARMPVIAVTALAMVGDRERLLAAGFDGYLAKPIEPQTFVAEVEGLLRDARAQERHDAPGEKTERTAWPQSSS